MYLGRLLSRAGAATGGGGGGHAPGDPSADVENVDVQHYLGYIWIAFVAVFTTYQAVLHLTRYVRTVVCLNNETQRYFATPHALFANFRKYFLDAPLFRTRHHREFKLSSAINIGTLPTRLQTVMIAGYFATNVGLAVWKVDFGNDYATVAKEVRNRTGVMAVMNMIPLFLLAGRNNPVIKLTQISFDTMNLIHRWFGRIVVLEALTHMICWMAGKVHTSKFRLQCVATALTIHRGMGCCTGIHHQHQGPLYLDWLHGGRCIYLSSHPVSWCHSPCVLRDLLVWSHYWCRRRRCWRVDPSRRQAPAADDLRCRCPMGYGGAFLTSIPRPLLTQRSDHGVFSGLWCEM